MPSKKERTDICPYCSSPLEFGECNEIPALNYKELRTKMLGYRVLKCSNYPKCDAYVVFPYNSMQEPGVVANKFLRTLRQQTHRICDLTWKTGILEREKWYDLLSGKLKISKMNSHIRYFSVYDCIDVIIRALVYLNENFESVNINRLTALSKDEAAILRVIIKMNIIHTKKCDYTKEDIKNIISLIFDDEVRKVHIVNMKRLTCSFFKNHDLVVYQFSGNTLSECIKSITEQLYNDFANNYGYPTL